MLYKHRVWTNLIVEIGGDNELVEIRNEPFADNFGWATVRDMWKMMESDHRPFCDDEMIYFEALEKDVEEMG